MEEKIEIKSLLNLYDFMSNRAVEESVLPENSLRSKSSDVPNKNVEESNSPNRVIGDIPPKKSFCPKNKITRCNSCNQKLKLVEATTGKCRCGLVFCQQHRLAEHHKCQYDYKQLGRKTLELANPKINSPKVLPI